VADDFGNLLQELDALIAAPESGVPPRSRIERTLTDGYARALSLEAERWRLQRRIGELAAGLEDGSDLAAGELAALSRRLSSTGDELSGLRRRLRALRARVAGAPA
jgi:hypothetical protein